jgi:hypothetical protein
MTTKAVQRRKQSNGFLVGSCCGGNLPDPEPQAQALVTAAV